ncbi:unnamed protein product, partial [Darwinula stevensoni]
GRIVFSRFGQKSLFPFSEPSVPPVGEDCVDAARQNPDEIGATDLNFLMVLGRGSFSKVMLAERKGTEELFAIKIRRKDIFMKEDLVKCAMIEKRVHALPNKPPFLVQLHSCFQTKIILQQPYGKSVDWWAYGVLLYEMLVGEAPFDGENEVLFAAITDQPVSYPKFLSKEAKDACKGFLTKNTSKRLGCGPKGEEDVRNHPFFRPIDWETLESREVQPPFQPKIKNPRSGENFDPIFTHSTMKMSPVDECVIRDITEDIFQGFSFVNPSYAPIHAEAPLGH